MRSTTRNRLHHGISLALIASSAHAVELRHYWNFEDENARFADSAGGVNGTVTEDSTVWIGEGRQEGTSSINTIATVAGPRDFVSLNGTDPAFFQPGTGAFSMTFWFRMPTDTAANRGIFDFSGNGFDGPQMLLTSANSLNFRVDGTGTYNLVAALPGATVEDDGWHFVAAVYDPALETDTLKFYLDGATVSASASRGAASAAAVVSPAGCWLGTFNYNGTSEVKGLNGDLDDVAYYSGALSSEEIAGIFAGTMQPTDFMPVPSEIQLTRYLRDAATGESTLRWQSVSGRSYTVWGSTNLSAWTELTTSPIAGTGGELEYLHTPAGSPNAYFYQIRD
jgi:hypothetical protein